MTSEVIAFGSCRLLLKWLGSMGDSDKTLRLDWPAFLQNVDDEPDADEIKAATLAFEKGGFKKPAKVHGISQEDLMNLGAGAAPPSEMNLVFIGLGALASAPPTTALASKQAKHTC